MWVIWVSACRFANAWALKFSKVCVFISEYNNEKVFCSFQALISVWVYLSLPLLFISFAMAISNQHIKLNTLRNFPFFNFSINFFNFSQNANTQIAQGFSIFFPVFPFLELKRICVGWKREWVHVCIALNCWRMNEAL